MQVARTSLFWARYYQVGRGVSSFWEIQVPIHGGSSRQLHSHMLTNVWAASRFMSNPKRHHYVPQMLLRNFTNGEGVLHWCFTKGGDRKIRPAPPSEIFHERHLYSIRAADGSKDTAVENRFLSSLEGAATTVINDILNAARKNEPPVLTASQLGIWNFFFITQWRRTPDNYQAILGDEAARLMLNDIITDLRAVAPHMGDELDRLSTPEQVERLIKNARVDTLMEASPAVLNVLERRGIAVLRIEKPDKSFIIGSRPVVKLTPPGRTDLNDTSVEMWLPVSSDVAVGLGSGNGVVGVYPLSDDRIVRSLNVSITAQSRIIASRSEALVRSLINRR